MSAAEKMLRKTCRFTPAQLDKLKTIARQNGTSVSAVVREAIYSYIPDVLENEEDKELKELCSMFIKSATGDLRDARKRLEKGLDELSRSQS